MDMDFIIAAGLVAFCLLVFGAVAIKLAERRDKKKQQLANATSSSSMPMRRKRLNGGFYPVGYKGSYDEGEDLVDFAFWMMALMIMTSEERYMFDSYGDMEGYADGYLAQPDGSYLVDDIDSIIDASPPLILDDPMPDLDPDSEPAPDSSLNPDPPPPDTPYPGPTPSVEPTRVYDADPAEVDYGSSSDSSYDSGGDSGESYD